MYSMTHDSFTRFKVDDYATCHAQTPKGGLYFKKPTESNSTEPITHQITNILQLYLQS